MDFELLEFEIGGHPIDPDSLTDARVKIAGYHWNLFVRADRRWSFDEFIGMARYYDTGVRVRVDGRILAGRGHFAHYEFVGSATIEVWILGDSALEPVSDAEPVRDQSGPAELDALLADGWREVVD